LLQAFARLELVSGTLQQVDEALRALARGRRAGGLHRAACRAARVELDPPSFFLLSLLDEEPRRLTDLAARVGLDASTVSRKLHSLEAAGLMGRDEDPADGRAALVRLRPEGQRALARVARARLALLEEALDGWSDDDRRELARLLGRFAESLSQVGRPGAESVSR
jgi:DNA-binding MarR family transcriptional regulator